MSRNSRRDIRGAGSTQAELTGDDRAVTTPSFETVFDLLSNDRRRWVCHHLLRADETAVELDDLVEGIARREAEGEPPEELVAEIETTLHHVHLPKLAAADIVDYDHRTAVLRYWRQPTLEELVEHAAAVGPDDGR